MQTHDMNHFFALRAEKQQHIIDAALAVFGKNGYKKASVADIATMAGIAKGMVAYYFGCKRGLYLYLANHCGKIVMNGLSSVQLCDDFFERIKTITAAKINMMKRHPAIFAFLTRLYYETDPEVAEDVAAFRQHSTTSRQSMLYAEADTSKLKPGIDPALLDKFLTWAGQGMAEDLLSNMERVDEYTSEFFRLLDIMKLHFTH